MKYLYEFVGAFFLVFTVGMTMLTPYIAGYFAPLAVGSALAVMVFAGGHVSGGHYNPAVSFAAFLRGKLKSDELISYWVAQIAAAIAAGWLAVYIKGAAADAPMTMDAAKAFIVEFLFTFALCFVFLNVATNKKTAGNSYFGFAIGFTILVGMYAVGAISGGAFNPAVAVGMAMINMAVWSNLWIFIVANLLGGAVATLVYKSANPKD